MVMTGSSKKAMVVPTRPRSNSDGKIHYDALRLRAETAALIGNDENNPFNHRYFRPVEMQWKINSKTSHSPC